jgi:hypothetical protein
VTDLGADSGAAQVAILLSHLRAVSAGSSVGGPFLVLEEDVDLGLLLAAPATRVHALLEGLPPDWHVLQASVRCGYDQSCAREPNSRPALLVGRLFSLYSAAASMLAAQGR